MNLSTTYLKNENEEKYFVENNVEGEVVNHLYHKDGKSKSPESDTFSKQVN